MNRVPWHHKRKKNERDFITYYQGADYYGLGLKVFTRMAHEAGSVYKIGKKVLINRSIVYLRNISGSSVKVTIEKSV
ncbi:DUF6462 family protein [Parabacteroides goldsteinii]|uniref:DUF6462 family protein n=1 Tax=Parabacteroides goldsteinii TaxID=328812 RepID=UPI0033A889BE